jgi:hypothetical protein
MNTVKCVLSSTNIHWHASVAFASIIRVLQKNTDKI